MTDRQQLDSFIAKFTPEVAGMAQKAFAWMRRKYPRATVLVYDNYNALAIGFGSTERVSDIVFSIALYPRWVSFFFFHGASLPDPAKRLKGSGNQVRYFVIDRIEVLEEPAVLALMDAAVDNMETGWDAGVEKNPSGKIVIKSVSAKQRPRRPPSAVKKSVKKR
jgi:hypothetical protein